MKKGLLLAGIILAGGAFAAAISILSSLDLKYKKNQH